MGRLTPAPKEEARSEERVGGMQYSEGCVIVAGRRIPAQEVAGSLSKRPIRRVLWADVPAELRATEGEPSGCQAAVYYDSLGPLTAFRHCRQKLAPGERFCPTHGGKRLRPQGASGRWVWIPEGSSEA